jgi:hypothetical protein
MYDKLFLWSQGSVNNMELYISPLWSMLDGDREGSAVRSQDSAARCGEITRAGSRRTSMGVCELIKHGPGCRIPT